MGAKYVLDGTDYCAAMFNPEGDAGIGVEDAEEVVKRRETASGCCLGRGFGAVGIGHD